MLLCEIVSRDGLGFVSHFVSEPVSCYVSRLSQHTCGFVSRFVSPCLSFCRPLCLPVCFPSCSSLLCEILSRHWPGFVSHFVPACPSFLPGFVSHHVSHFLSRLVSHFDWLSRPGFGFVFHFASRYVLPSSVRSYAALCLQLLCEILSRHGPGFVSHLVPAFVFHFVSRFPLKSCRGMGPASLPTPRFL